CQPPVIEQRQHGFEFIDLLAATGVEGNTATLPFGSAHGQLRLLQIDTADLAPWEGPFAEAAAKVDMPPIGTLNCTEKLIAVNEPEFILLDIALWMSARLDALGDAQIVEEDLATRLGGSARASATQPQTRQ